MNNNYKHHFFIRSKTKSFTYTIATPAFFKLTNFYFSFWKSSQKKYFLKRYGLDINGFNAKLFDSGDGLFRNRTVPQIKNDDSIISVARSTSNGFRVNVSV